MANFGDIGSSITLGAGESIKRNAGDDGFEAFTPSEGAGVSIYEATVGVTGGDYATLGAAITAGKTRILVIDDTTETGDITMPSELIVHGIGMYNKSINMSTYSLLDSTNSNFEISNIKIITSKSSGYLISTANGLNLLNIYFDASGGNGGVIFMDPTTNPNYIKNIHIKCKNGNYSKLAISATANTFIDGLVLQGNGSSTYGVASLGGVINGLIISGTYNSANSILSFRGIIDTITQDNTDAYIFTVTGQSYYQDIISNIKLPTADFVINGECLINNFCLDSIVLGGDNAVINNGYLKNTTTGLTIGSGFDRTQVSNVKMLGGVSITGNDTTITGCRVGADAGGGSNTITVNAGANRTIIGNTRTDAAIVDNGTATSASNNVVY